MPATPVLVFCILLLDYSKDTLLAAMSLNNNPKKKKKKMMMMMLMVMAIDVM